MSGGLTCVRFAEIARTVSPDDVPALQMHLGACPYCRTQWAATRQAIEAARQIPYQAPGPEERMRIRHAVLWNVSRPSHRATSSRRWLQAAAYAAGILGAAGVFAAVGSVALPWLRGRGHEMQNLERARPRTPGVMAPKPEPAVLALPVLDDSKPTPSKTSAEKGVRRPAAMRKLQAPAAESQPAPESRTPGPAELTYAEGWEAIRVADYARAAESMKRSAEAAPASSLATDARYWEAVALARAGQTGKARTAMEAFLRRHPASPRTGEVAVMLAWMLIEAREWPRAEQLFRSAENDRAPSVRDSARQGLETVARVQARSKPAR